MEVNKDGKYILKGNSNGIEGLRDIPIQHSNPKTIIQSDNYISPQPYNIYASTTKAKSVNPPNELKRKTPINKTTPNTEMSTATFDDILKQQYIKDNENKESAHIIIQKK